jgi:DNA-binding NarL/FixJ family response regulator
MRSKGNLADRINVLIVEHSRLARAVLEKSITTNGELANRCIIEATGSYEAASKALASTMPDVIITDVALGDEVEEGENPLLGEILRMSEATGYEPQIIIATPNEDAAAVTRATDLGLDVCGYAFRSKLNSRTAEDLAKKVEGITERNALKKFIEHKQYFPPHENRKKPGFYNASVEAFDSVVRRAVQTASDDRMTRNISIITSSKHQTERTIGIAFPGLLGQAIVERMLHASDTSLRLVVLPHSPESQLQIESIVERDPRVYICQATDIRKDEREILERRVRDSRNVRSRGTRETLAILAKIQEKGQRAFEEYFDPSKRIIGGREFDADRIFLHIIAAGSGFNPARLAAEKVHLALYEKELPVFTDVVAQFLPWYKKAQAEKWDLPGNFGYMLWQTNPIEFALAHAMKAGFNPSLLYGQTQVDTIRAKRVISDQYNAMLIELENKTRKGRKRKTKLNSKEIEALARGPINDYQVVLPCTIGPHGGEDMFIPFKNVYITFDDKSIPFHETPLSSRVAKDAIHEELRVHWVKNVLQQHGVSTSLPAQGTLETVASILSNYSSRVAMMGYRNVQGYNLFTNGLFQTNGNGLIIAPDDDSSYLTPAELNTYRKALQKHDRWQRDPQRYIHETRGRR